MTLKKSTFNHPRWGTIIVTCNPRARHIIMRARPEAIHMTIPPRATEADVENALSRCGDKLLMTRQDSKQQLIDKEYTIESPNFGLSIRECKTTEIKVTGKNGTYILHCPEGTDYSNDKTQQALRYGIKAAMRHRAGTVLPQRLKELATKHGFKYNGCSVRDARSRWGSCNTRKNISLNVQLVMLPQRLIDYVLLHELCHTVEMNHGERFWALLDLCTAPEKAKALRADLKNSRIML